MGPLVDASQVAITMADKFPVFEVLLNRRGRKWSWTVCTSAP